MNILTINVLYPPLTGGGVEITIKNLYQGLTYKGHNVNVLTLTEKNFYTETIEGVKVYREPIPNLYLPYFANESRPFIAKRILWHLFDIYNFSSKKILSRYLVKLEPDVVICHNIFGWSPSIWSTCKEYNVPTIQVLHDQNLLCPRNMFKNNKVCKKRCLVCKLMRIPHKKLSNKITGVVGVSQFILDKFIDNKYFIDVSVKEVIYNSRNLSLQNLEAKKSRETVNFGYIGNIAPNKGVENLLIAFHKINNKNIKLFVAGNGDKKYLSYLKSRYYCDNVYLLGYVKPEDFFSQIDVTVVPSIWEENFPGVVLESFAYGVPVIGSRIGGIPEMIDENMNGLLFDSVSVEDLSNKMLDFLHSISYWRNNRQAIQKSSEPFLNYWKWIEKWENLLVYIKDLD